MGIVSRIRIESVPGLGAVEYNAEDGRIAVSAGASRWEADLPAYYANSNEWLRDAAAPDQFLALLAPEAHKSELNVETMRANLKATLCQRRRAHCLGAAEARGLFDAVTSMTAEHPFEAFEDLQGTGLFDALGDAAMDAIAGAVTVTVTPSDESTRLQLVHGVLMDALRN